MARRFEKLANFVARVCVVSSISMAAACSAAAEDEERQSDGESAEDALEGAEPAPLQSVEAYTATTVEDRVVTKAMTRANAAEVAAGARLAVVRSMTVAGVPSVLAYDARSFDTVIVARDALDASSRKATADDGDNAYVKKLDATRRDGATLTRVRPPRAGHLDVALTIDMCQSSKPWEKALFDFLVDVSAQRRAPVQVGIAMTGGWAKAHTNELAQLREWNARGALAISWINHSYTHPLHCTNGGRTCTFLTDASISPEAFEHEVLDNERLLLRQGLAVSPLFRFPGLTHDGARRRALGALSVFALDADAWLAKGERMHDGAVVLLHGNGNEPKGIELFMQAMRTETWRQGLRSGAASFVSPVRALVDE